MDVVPMVFSSGWASGVNAYLLVLVLGLAERFGHVTQVPGTLGRTEVLVVAGVLFAVEFVADKVPYLDSTWDGVSTVIRPTVGAALAILVAAQPDVGATGWAQAGYALLGGGTALASHTVKAGTRLAINTSPEPVSNITTSLGEDGLVLAVALLVLHHPWVALGITATLLVLGGLLLWRLLRAVRHGWRRWRGRSLGRTAAPPTAGRP